MKKFIVFLVILTTLTTLSAQGIAFEKEETAWADVLKKAKAENKIVFVDAYTTWCGPCKVMSKNIFPQKEVGDVFNARFVNAKIDMEKGEGPEIAKKYGVRAYPTYIFVNGDGELVHRSLGSMPAEKFIAVGEAASDPERQFYSLKKKYEDGQRGADFLKNLAFACESAQETTMLPAVVDAYLETQKDWLTKDNMQFILKFGTSIESPLFAFMVKNQDAFQKELAQKDFKAQIDQMAFMGVANATYNRTKGEFDFVKAKELGAKYLTKDMTDKSLSNMTLAQFQMKNDMPGYMNHAITHFDKYPSENAQELNQVAWGFYENSTDKAQLQKALGWSLKSIELDDIFAFNDTAAALYYKLGDKQNAKTYAEKAIKLAKASGDDASETEALLKKIEAM